MLVVWPAAASARRDLGVPERCAALSRAGPSICRGPERLQLSDAEVAYLLAFAVWLIQTLGIDPTLRLAVLVGSLPRGEETAGSNIDCGVGRGRRALYALAGRRGVLSQVSTSGTSP
jgi:hypothetical protein